VASIFFSYRKQGEDKPSSLRLADDLRAAFGEEAVFRDEKGLKFGRFKDQLIRQVESCKIIIAVIGPTWISRIKDLHRDDDWVRRELEIGLERKIEIAPVLVEGAIKPEKSDLPDSMGELFEFQFTTIHPRHWKTEVGQFIDDLAEYLNLEKRETAGVKQVSIPNLSGNWFDTEGEAFQLAHSNDTLQMMAYDAYGQAIGQGTGSIEGSQIQFSLQRIDYGYGTGRGTVTPDGRLISGEVQYGIQRFPFSLTKH